MSAPPANSLPPLYTRQHRFKIALVPRANAVVEAMAAMTSTIGHAKLGCSTSALRQRQSALKPTARVTSVVRASGASALNEMVPDRSKRTTMNWLLVGALGLPGLALAGPFAYFFKPAGCDSLPLRRPRRPHLGLCSWKPDLNHCGGSHSVLCSLFYRPFAFLIVGGCTQHQLTLELTSCETTPVPFLRSVPLVRTACPQCNARVFAKL